MTYIKAPKEMIDAAVAFYAAHKDIFERWEKQERTDIAPEFMELCRAVKAAKLDSTARYVASVNNQVVV